MDFSSDLYSGVVAQMMSYPGIAQITTLTILGEDGVYYVDTGTISDPTNETFTVKAILLDYKLNSNGTQVKPGTVIEQGDKQCYLTPYDTDGNAIPTPSPTGDTLTDAQGVVWRILNIKEYNPTGASCIMYDLMLRR